nr:lipid II flippase MurJ [Desulfolutivibrio sulfodismutans]
MPPRGIRGSSTRQALRRPFGRERHAMSQEVMDGIRRSTLIIVGLTLLDKILALAKEMLFAYRFGVSRDLDVFNVAYAFPAILAMLLGQAVVSALVPLYMTWRERGPGELSRNLANLGSAAILFFLVLTVACAFWSEPIMAVIGYGFPEGEKALGESLVRLLVWLIFLEGGAAVLAGVLQADKSFAALYGAQLCINLAIIAALSFFGDMGVHALAMGFLIGTGVKALVMAVVLRGARFPLRPPRPPVTPCLREFFLLAWPLVIGGLVVNSNILVDQVMSTELPSGSVSALRYAYRINDLPLQLFVVAAAKAIFPFVSEQAEARDALGMRRVFWRGVLFLCMVSAGMTAFVLIFSTEIVTLLLRRGAFDDQAVASTALTLSWYAAGMVFASYAVLNGVFFTALRKNMTLMIVGVITMVCNAFFNLWFIRTIGGPEAVAMSTTVTVALTCTIFVAIIQRALGVFHEPPRLWPFLQVAGATLLAAGLAVAVRAGLTRLGLTGLWAFPAAALMFGAAFLGSLSLSRDTEIRWCLGMVLPWGRNRT